MAQVVPVGVGTTDQNAVFLDNAESRRCLSGSSKSSLPALCAEGGKHGGALGRDTGAAGQDVESDALAEEDLADWAADGGAVVDGVEGEGFAFFDMPFDAIRVI